MLKFVKHHLESIVGIEIFPLLSLCIFFVFFVILIVYVVSMNKGYLKNMETLPLETKSDEI